MGTLDDAGRRSSDGASGFWYVFAAVSYIGVSIFEKGLLNWFVGPLWLVTVVWVGPLLAKSLRRRRGRTP